MNVFTALLVAALPVSLLAFIGSRVLGTNDIKKGGERWLLFLLAAIALLLTGAIVSILSFGNRTPASFFIFLPCLWGSIAATVFHFLSGERLWPSGHLTWVLTGIILALLIWLGFTGEPSILPIVVFGGILTALVWQTWSWTNRWRLGAYIALVALLLLALWSTDTARPLLKEPAWFANSVQIVLALIPAAAIVVAARLVQYGFENDKRLDWHRLGLALPAVLILLALIGYQTMLASTWDVATDGLSGIFLVGSTSLAGIASALLLAWKLTGGRKLVATLFAVIVPVTMISAERLGTFDRDGKWGTLPIQVTDRRAEKIESALEQFHAENGFYPANLEELTPHYLLFIPVPYIIRGQDWCYEGGRDYYRFGYIYREMFSLPASVRIHSAKGDPPDPVWRCDEEAAKYQQVPGF